MKLTAAATSVQALVLDERKTARCRARRIQPKTGSEKMGSQTAVACPEATAKALRPSDAPNGRR